MEEILTPLQRKVLDTLFSKEEFASAFYLTGGTALAAFYLFPFLTGNLPVGGLRRLAGSKMLAGKAREPGK